MEAMIFRSPHGGRAKVSTVPSDSITDMSIKRLVGLILSLLGQVVVRPLTRDLDTGDTRRHAVKWLPAILVVAYTRFVENDDVSSLGVRWDGLRPFLKRVVVGLVVTLGANIVFAPVHQWFGTENIESEMAEYEDTSIPERLFIAVTAGVTEELLYRGYALERLEDETDRPALAAGGSILAFVLAHKSDQWGWKSLPLIAQPATLVTVLYMRSRDLLAVMTVHALNDAIGLLGLEQTANEE
jgi:membrane protease YdiL (CAAX protease family)